MRKKLVFMHFYILVALAGHLGGSCGLCRIFLSSFQPAAVSRKRGVYVQESEINRQNRVRIEIMRQARVQIHYLVYFISILSYVVLPRGAIPYPSVPIKIA